MIKNIYLKQTKQHISLKLRINSFVHPSIMKRCMRIYINAFLLATCNILLCRVQEGLHPLYSLRDFAIWYASTFGIAVLVAFSWPSQISQARNLFLAGKEISLSTPMTDWRFHGIAEFIMRNERISYPNFLLFS